MREKEKSRNRDSKTASNKIRTRENTKKNQNQKISIKEQGVSMDEGKSEVEETA